MYKRKLILSSNEDTLKKMSSILFYLNISKQKIITENYGSLANEDISSIEDCIRDIKGIVLLFTTDAAPDDASFSLEDWLSDKKDILDNI